MSFGRFSVLLGILCFLPCALASAENRGACYDVCRAQISGSEACAGIVSRAEYIQEDACRICGQLITGANLCLSAIVNKEYDSGALGICSSSFRAVECLANSGRPAR